MTTVHFLQVQRGSIWDPEWLLPSFSGAPSASVTHKEVPRPHPGLSANTCELPLSHTETRNSFKSLMLVVQGAGVPASQR